MGYMLLYVCVSIALHAYVVIVPGHSILWRRLQKTEVRLGIRNRTKVW